MKTVLVLMVVSIAGCAARPMTFEQRMAIANYMQHSRYVLPSPPQLSVPQTSHYLCNVNGSYVSCAGN